MGRLNPTQVSNARAIADARLRTLGYDMKQTRRKVYDSEAFVKEFGDGAGTKYFGDAPAEEVAVVTHEFKAPKRGGVGIMLVSLRTKKVLWFEESWSGAFTLEELAQTRFDGGTRR